MSTYRSDYVTYRLSKAAVSALLLQKDVTTQTHNGLKTQFNLLFVKTGIISIAQGRLYADLMDWRQKGDYGDMFDFDKESVEPLIAPVGELLNTIKALIGPI